MGRRGLLVRRVGVKVGIIRRTCRVLEMMEIWIGYGMVTQVKGKRLEMGKMV
jgi:hypothetical protein